MNVSLDYSFGENENPAENVRGGKEVDLEDEMEMIFRCIFR